MQNDQQFHEVDNTTYFYCYIIFFTNSFEDFRMNTITSPFTLGIVGFMLASANIAFCQTSISNDMNAAQTTKSDSTQKNSADSMQVLPTSQDAIQSEETEPPLLTRRTLSIQTNKDTLLVLTNASFKDIIDKATNRVRDSRTRGIGGGAGFSSALVWLDMTPVNEMLKQTDLDTMGILFPKGSTPITLFGGMGYGGLGNGIRVGGIGFGGSKLYTTRKSDTTYTISTGIGYGGLLIERALVVHQFNLLLGGIVGAGGIGVSLNKQQSRYSFGSQPSDIQYGIGAGGGAGAGFFLAELHCGFTYSIVSWLHIGGVGAALGMFSSNGFMKADGTSFGSGFITINPSAQLRIVLGNIS